MAMMGASFLPSVVDRMSPAEIEDLTQDDRMARAIFQSLLLQEGADINMRSQHDRGRAQTAGGGDKG